MTNFGNFKSLIESIRGNANGSEGRLGAARALDVYNRTKAPSRGFIPVFPGTYDMAATITAVAQSLGQEDLPATLNVIPSPWTSASTEPLSYTSVVLGMFGGAAILKRLDTTLPDITATLYGWDYRDLNAEVTISDRGQLDLEATVGSVAQTGYDILATIISTYTEDFPASLTSIPYSTLGGSLSSIPPSDLLTTLVTIPPKDLTAFGGGHYPKDIGAYLQTIPPSDFPAFIRSGYSSTSDLTSSITSSGGYSDFLCKVNALETSYETLRASITIRISYDIRARLYSWAPLNLTASIYGNHASSIQAYIKGVVVEETKDLPTFIRSAWGLTKDLQVGIHGWISAHTSDKLYNFHLLPRPAKTIFLAHSVGLTMMSVEPIRGYFPDLHASLVVRPLSVYDLRAFIRPTTLISSDLSASLSSVSSVINITKIPINFVNVSDLSVYISAFSGYKEISGSVIGEVSTSTGTASGSGWVYISSSINFYLGTNKGLYIPNRIQRVVRPEKFVNSSATPDLWAYMVGWAETSMSASITVQPNRFLEATIIGQDLSHVKSLTATIVSTYTKDITASITGSGGFSSLSAEIFISGAVNDLSATIRPYLKILGYRIISVETKPFLELVAVINPASSCSVSSGYGAISAFIRGTISPSGGSDLQASITSLSDVLNLGASIIGRKITKIKTVDVWFRSQTRGSEPLRALCVGVGIGVSDLSSSIKGIPHTNDLTASITPFRHVFNKISSVENIKVYKDYFTRVELYKTIDIHFSSQAQKYIYDALNASLYKVEGDRWVLNLAELTSEDAFFDRNIDDRNRAVDSLVEYDSIDEAIRAAIVILTEWKTVDLTASITSTGGFNNLSATVSALQPHRYSDLQASVSLVTNLPLLFASISAFSGYGALSAYIVGQGNGPEQLGADIIGVIYRSISASITGIL